MMKCLSSEEEQVAENIRQIRERMAEAAGKSGRSPSEVDLMAVTKTVPAERVNMALRAGISLLGENRVQECCEKYQNYTCKPETIHFIGHLQTNKIRDIIDKIGMIESIDSLHLAAALEKECEKRQMEMEILLQVNIAQESTKSGFLLEQIPEAIERIHQDSPHLHMRGLMAIPPKDGGDLWFGKMQQLFEKEREREKSFTTLSMGMSGDFEQAIRYGSTQIRIGTAIFGPRNYL
ncbi:MAG: YggS family pyridoxal phosphate-dependent enzyme [Candidatus Merdivicinus sp.]|jgi:pyridoxal phosphate enzyme (YggS family)